MKALNIKNENFIRWVISLTGLSFALLVLVLSLWVPLVNAVANYFLKDVAHISVQAITYQDKQLSFNDVWVRTPSGLRIVAKKLVIETEIQQILDGQYKAKAIEIDQLKTHGLTEDLSIKQIAAANVKLNTNNELIVERLNTVGYKQQSIKLSELISTQIRYHQDALSIDSMKVEEAAIDAPVKIVLSSLALNGAEVKNLSKQTGVAYSIKAIEVKDLMTDILGAAVNTASVSNIKGDASSIHIQGLDMSKASIDLKEQAAQSCR